MARFVELRRHTANDGDRLTAEGVEAALAIGADLNGSYALGVSSGAQRATQTVACLLAGGGHAVPKGVLVEPALRSEYEDRWRTIAGEAGSGAIDVLLAVATDFVEAEASRLSRGLRAVFEALDHGEMALVVGHSPTNEAAVYGLTGSIVPPMAKGMGVLLVSDARGHRVESLR